MARELGRLFAADVAAPAKTVKATAFSVEYVGGGRVQFNWSTAKHFRLYSFDLCLGDEWASLPPDMQHEGRQKLSDTRDSVPTSVGGSPGSTSKWANLVPKTLGHMPKTLGHTRFRSHVCRRFPWVDIEMGPVPAGRSCRRVALWGMRVEEAGAHRLRTCIARLRLRPKHHVRCRNRRRGILGHTRFRSQSGWIGILACERGEPSAGTSRRSRTR